MNKGDLIDSIAKQTGFTKTDSGAALDAVLDAVTGALMTGDRVSLPGFGSFEVKQRSAREGRNPATGAKIKIKAKKVVKFNTGKKLDDSVN
jgi:DNA-binding protein HU-beta